MERTNKCWVGGPSGQAEPQALVLRRGMLMVTDRHLHTACLICCPAFSIPAIFCPTQHMATHIYTHDTYTFCAGWMQLEHCSCTHTQHGFKRQYSSNTLGPHTTHSNLAPITHCDDLDGAAPTLRFHSRCFGMQVKKTLVLAFVTTFLVVAAGHLTLFVEDASTTRTTPVADTFCHTGYLAS